MKTKTITREQLEKALCDAAERRQIFTLYAFEKKLKVRRPQAKACLALLVAEGSVRFLFDYHFQRL